MRTVEWDQSESGRREFARLEWLVTNGLGGYASGCISGALTRRYHGLLVAALPAPLGRTMMLNAVHEWIRRPDGRSAALVSAAATADGVEFHDGGHLADFRLENGLPVWVYDVDGTRIEKRVFMPHLQNTSRVAYRLLSGDPIALELQPAIACRPHDTPVNAPTEGPYLIRAIADRFEIEPGGDLPVLRLAILGGDSAFTLRSETVETVVYRLERARGYAWRGPLWRPGAFRVELSRDAVVTLVASTEPWETIHAVAPDDLVEAERRRREQLLVRSGLPDRGIAGELLLAADQFIVVPGGRTHDAARAQAAGDEARTVVAGYHWFTDWGRDTMISLEGLTLCTGRHREAGYILRTFRHYVRDGLIPNLFPEGAEDGLYHTADATLWFFHALHRYLRATGDRLTLQFLLPALQSIFEAHVRGTRFGIHVDPDDGLLVQGQEGYQLTWMDAKVGDWVVTPRRGKAVEINALWFNALALLAGWLRDQRVDGAERVQEAATRVRESFNRRFWYPEGGYLYDIVDGERGDDPSCRPNQILAVSLDHPVLDPARWRDVFETVTRRLRTPVGLRSLDPAHPDYKARYDGDLRARDAAYHQGTVWAWLAGPYVDAWLRVEPSAREAAHEYVEGFGRHLGDAGIGTLSEIFDGSAPFIPRGCIAQAWSVAEVLRAWVATMNGDLGRRFQREQYARPGER